ncbi:DUF6081 family protein [Streptomyces collinus]|uniref:DUF6081 family protein n=1 Tax=Streptomyces collinus TaxID=42684 RepID=UPI0038195FEB
MTAACGSPSTSSPRASPAPRWPTTASTSCSPRRNFALPESGKISFSASLAAEAINATPYDYRDGFAAVVLCDPHNGWVYDLCTNGDTVFAINEHLAYPGVTSPFTRVVNDPLFGPSATPGQLYHCEITIDTADKRITWQMDGKTVHEELVAELPTSLKMGMGIFTVHQIAEGASRSLRGQGFTAYWRDLRVRSCNRAPGRLPAPIAC